MTGVTRCCGFRVACNTREKRICDTRLTDMLIVQALVDKCRHQTRLVNDSIVILANSHYRNVTDSLPNARTQEIQIRYVIKL